MGDPDDYYVIPTGTNSMTDAPVTSVTVWAI
jgi:hypothetical protein